MYTPVYICSVKALTLQHILNILAFVLGMIFGFTLVFLFRYLYRRYAKYLHILRCPRCKNEFAQHYYKDPQIESDYHRDYRRDKKYHTHVYVNEYILCNECIKEMTVEV